MLKGSSVKGTPATKSLPGGTRDLSSHPTMSIVKALKEKQKVIYGTDDRKDVYEVHSKNISMQHKVLWRCLIALK